VEYVTIFLRQFLTIYADNAAPFYKYRWVRQWHMVGLARTRFREFLNDDWRMISGDGFFGYQHPDNPGFD